LAALGHKVKLMPPGYVKAYVKPGKNDAVAGAAAHRAGQCAAVKSRRIVTP
jgi:transposase